MDAEVRRREEEELQRALEISVKDKGGRANWGEYSLASSSGAGTSNSHPRQQPDGAGPSASSSSAVRNEGTSTFPRGYAPGPERPESVPSYAASTGQSSSASASTATLPTPAVSRAFEATSPTPSSTSIVTRVRALHKFEPTEPGELAFEKGDIIKVVDRGYKDWWRGQLKGRTGIFPVNYVVSIPSQCTLFACPVC